MKGYRLQIAALAGLLWPSAAAAESQLSVGFAEVDVTPVLGKKPVYLAGFGHDRRATKVHDPIFVRAVVLADGKQKVALVTADVVGLFYPSVERVRAKLPGFLYVLVSATHNHGGPDTLGLWGPSPFTSGLDHDYVERLEAACVAAATEAAARRRPAAARVGTAKAPELLRDSRLPEVKLDELVAVEFRDPKTEAALGAIVQWNNHAEVLDGNNAELTADFVGYALGRLKADRKVPVVYITGAVGGLMTPLRLEVKDAAGGTLADGTFAKAERYGALVAAAADAALAGAEGASLLPFEARSRTLLVPVENNLYRLGWQLGTLRRPMFQWHGDPTPRESVEARDIAKPVAVRTEVGYLRLGDLEVAVIPGEIYPELVLGRVQDPPDPAADFPAAPVEPAIYAALKPKRRMVVGLGNDELGYIIPKRQWDEKPPFCYGLKKAQYGEANSLGPDTAPILCKAFRELAANVK